MCMNCKKFKNGCDVKEYRTGGIFKETDNNIMNRYSAALNKIGSLNLLSLPEPVQDILKQSTNLETKVLMLEKIAEQIN